MTTMSAKTVSSDPAALAAEIHDDVLQSLGVAVLGVDLCRRFHTQKRYELALDEITGIGEALSLALVSSVQLLPHLQAVLPSSRRTRPVAMGSEKGTGRPSASPQEIVDTLTSCASQALRCRGQYDAGLGDDTLDELELMCDRLDFASAAYREVMGQLRQLAGRDIDPQSAKTRPTIVAWSRSA